MKFLRFIQFVGAGFLAVGRGFKSLFTEIPCAKCILLEELLKHETERKEYFEQLILTRSGFITDREAVLEDAVEFPSIHRLSTISSIRKQAADLAKAAHDRAANSKEKTAAETKFEEELAKVN